MEYNDFACEMKGENNCTIARWIKKYLGSKKHFVLELDGPLVGTARALIDAGVSTPARIYAPQFNSAHADQMEKYGQCKVIRGSLCDAIWNLDGKGIPKKIIGQIAVLHADYMGAIFGNAAKGLYPLSDLCDFLYLTKQDKLILAFTFSDRMGPHITREIKLYDNRKNLGEQIDLDFLTPAMNHAQYAVRQREYYSYRRTPNSAQMWFFIYYVEKDPSINPARIELARSPFDPTKLWGYDPKSPDTYVPAPTKKRTRTLPSKVPQKRGKKNTKEDAFVYY
jgi:hypothetical protein